MIRTQIVVVFDKLRALVSDMLDMAKSQHNPEHRFQQVLEILKKLPLNSSEFATYQHRLMSAWKYAGNSEFGAAAFELRLVLRSIERNYGATLPQIEFPFAFPLSATAMSDAS